MATPVNKEDLLVSLREKHGQDFVSMGDLEHPSSDFMMRYFITVLAQLGVDVKGMTNHKLLQSLSHADSYRDIRHYSQVYMAVKKVCPIPTYLTNFSLLSLMEPKPEDIFYVAAMDNFYDYYFQSITEHLQPCLQKRDRLEALLQEKKRQNSEFLHQLNDEAAARSKRAMEQAQAERRILEVDRDVEELRQQVQHLEKVVAVQKKACSELRQEVEDKKLRQEQLEDQLQAQDELQTLRQKLEQLQSQRAEQDRELAEKRSALQEKTSRQHFLEECLGQEMQAMEAVVELVEHASQVEKQKKSVLMSKAKKELVVRKLLGAEKTRNDLGERKAALEKDIAVQNNICITSRKELKDLTRDIEDAKDVISKVQQDTRSLEDQIKNVEEKFLQKKKEMSILDETFQKEHDKLYEKVASIGSELRAALKKRMQEK